jgi:iron(III) transport system permease protein
MARALLEGRPRLSIRPWWVLSSIVLLLVAAPLAALVFLAWTDATTLWEHLVTFVLPVAARDTVLLLTGVAIVATTIGAAAAWLVAAYDFPGRRILDWALLLPLAVPTYVIAYAYLDLLHPIGPVQTALRAILGYETPREFRLPDVRSMAGCVFVLGVVLYPYVYLTTRALFLMQAANLLDAARTLGAGRAAVFLRVALPLARPAVAVGCSLALMEALNDIGAAEFLGVRTLTVSIYTTWVTRADLAGAAQIALAMLALVAGLLLVERWARRQRRYANDAQHPRLLRPRRLRGPAAAAAFGAGLLPVAAGFLAPAAYLAHAAATRIGDAGLSPRLADETLNTVGASLLGTVVTLGCAIVVAYAARLGRGMTAAALPRLASLGYAVPGTVIAIGLLPVAGAVDALLDLGSTLFLGVSVGLLTIGSGAALIYAYLVRFLAVGTGGVDAGFQRVSSSIDEAARTLGARPVRRLLQVHLPLVRPAVASAALLLFVDCMKELPATLLLRPIGFETLATHLYGEAVRGTYEDAAVAALLIVAAGLLPVILLARVSDMRNPETAAGLLGPAR